MKMLSNIVWKTFRKDKGKFENKGKIKKSLDGVSPNFNLLFTDLNSHEGSLMEDFFQ